MKAKCARPELSEMLFLVYGRTLHPELFKVLTAREIQRDNYCAQVRITDDCHVVSWRCRDTLLTEVVAHARSPLPAQRRLIMCKLSREREEIIQCGHGVTYQASFTVERLDPQLFSRLNDELEADAGRRGISHVFQPSHRLFPSPLSYINFEARARSLLVLAFHTFPEDCAIFKSQSLFEFGE